MLEVISKIQTMRKDADFEVTDHIRVGFAGNEKISDIAMAHKDSIMAKVLADDMQADASFGVSKEWNVNGENVTISVERV